MEKEILVILMAAFGLFAIVMFVLFFIYLKKYYNNKHLDDDYQKDLDKEILEEDNTPVMDIIIPLDKKPEPIVNEVIQEPQVSEVKEEEQEIEFVPIKKK